MALKGKEVSLKDKLSIEDVDLTDKRVLIRVDFNVPFEDGRITNNQRIVAALETIREAIQKTPKAVILMSHFGRPNGEVVKKWSLRPVASELEKLLGRKVVFTEDCVGKKVEDTVNAASGSQVILLENLRFHEEEEGGKNIKVTDPKTGKEKDKFIPADEAKINDFRTQLTALGDVYINDAFGTAHRAHSSIDGIDLTQKAAGLLMKKELDAFASVLEAPKEGFLAILGGAKVVDKIGLIEKLIPKVETIAIGGGMAFTFKKTVENVKIGKSLFDEEGSEGPIVKGVKRPGVKDLVDMANNENTTLVFPVDYIIAKKVEDDAETRKANDNQGIPDDWMGLDIGEESIALFKKAIKDAKIILWNGPPGVFEKEIFSHGTKAIMDAVVEAAERGATVIVGGGDTATAAAKYGVEEKLTHVSTGGGASLKLIESGGKLVGIETLSNK